MSAHTGDVDPLRTAEAVQARRSWRKEWDMRGGSVKRRLGVMMTACLLLVGILAAPASAGYMEGNISCAPG